MKDNIEQLRQHMIESYVPCAERFREWFIQDLDRLINCLSQTEPSEQNKFINSPLHDKNAIIELMNNLNPEQMAKVVDFIQSQTESSEQKPSVHRCRYSKTMNQEYPRKCIDCGKLESNV